MPASPKPPPLPEAQPAVVVGVPEGAGSLVLGRVLGAFGIQGWIRIRPFTDSPGSLLQQSAWGLRRGALTNAVQVEESKTHGAFVLARLTGVTDRGQAEALRGWDVTVPRDHLPQPEPGEYYWSDLIGLSVRNRAGVELGRVAGLIEAPAHDVLRVDNGKGGEQLIPFVEPIVCAVDSASGCITVEWEADW
ncbi:MAG: ribosome maturation factor RimM [Betaproteobacteria bacterium]